MTSAWGMLFFGGKEQKGNGTPAASQNLYQTPRACFVTTYLVTSRLTNTFFKKKSCKELDISNQALYVIDIMAQITPQFKESLEAVGCFDAYLDRIEEIVSIEGVSSTNAKAKAAKEFESQAIEGSRKLKTQRKAELLQAKKSASSLAPLPPLPALPSSAFDSHQSSTDAKDAKWVARNMIVEDPDIEECPSHEAWAMLNHYRQNPAERSKFWDKYLQKIKFDGDDNDQDKGTYDGLSQVQVLEELEQIRKEARSAAL
jgi:hypothetical protein